MIGLRYSSEPTGVWPLTDTVVGSYPAGVIYTSMGVMHKVRAGVTQAALPGVLGLMMSGTVFAAEDELHVTTLDTAELSLYTTPQQKLRYVEAEVGQLEQGVATVRQITRPYVTWFQGFYGKVNSKVVGLVQFGNDSYTYLRNPPSEFYPQAAVIGSAGLLGLFLARGSRVKRLLYPAGLMGVGASLYHPQHAAAIAKSTSNSLYAGLLQGFVSMETVLKLGNRPSVEKMVKENPENPATEAKP